MHLPHHGLPPALLRTLPSFGDPEVLPLDVHIDATRALAVNRLFPIAKIMIDHLHRIVEPSELRPLGSLSQTGSSRLGFTLQPAGWDGGAFARHVLDAHEVLLRARAQTAEVRKHEP